MSRPRFYLDWKEAQKRKYYADSAFLSMIEDSNLIIQGLETLELTLNPLTGDTVGWGPLSLTSALTGKTLSVAAGSSGILDGDIMYLRGIKHPVENQSLRLYVGRSGSRDVKKFGNLFLAVRKGDVLLMRPAAKTSGDRLRIPGEEYRLIAEAVNGVTAPSALTTYINGNARVSVRSFPNTGASVHFVWETPADLDITEPVQMCWCGILYLSAATGTVVRLNFSAYAIGDNEGMDQSFGTAVPSSSVGNHGNNAKILGTLVNVTIPNLVPSRLVHVKLERDTGNTYLDAIYIYGVKILYQREMTP